MCSSMYKCMYVCSMHIYNVAVCFDPLVGVLMKNHSSSINTIFIKYVEFAMPVRLLYRSFYILFVLFAPSAVGPLREMEAATTKL